MFRLKLIVNIVLYVVVIFAIPLFVPAGTLDWWRAWLIVGLVLVGSIGAVINLARSHRSLLEERLKPPIVKGQPLADKVVLLLLFAAFLGTMFSQSWMCFACSRWAGPERFFHPLGSSSSLPVGGSLISLFGRALLPL